MATPPISVETSDAIDRLMRYLAIPGITGQEEAIGAEIANELVDGVGLLSDQLWFDKAHKDIPLPTQTGNLIVRLPGTRKGKRLLFMTHLDTVPLCAGAVPVWEKNRIVPRGKTALGGDNRTGCACLVTLVKTLIEQRIPHPPITVLFTVREESGLWGARFVKKANLGNPVYGFNVDGGQASALTIGAVGAERWEVAIYGKASHAGVHPERGISSTMVAALALASIHKDGWFGKIQKNRLEGTSNIGSFGGFSDLAAGNATNVVTDYVLIRGEARSHSEKFTSRITRAYQQAFDQAAKLVKNDEGKTAKVEFESRLDYYPFEMEKDSPVVRHALAATRELGLEPTLRVTNGGLDANWLYRHGVPTLTFGAGQNNVHTVDEYVDLEQFEAGCNLALALATLET